jgi:cation:H+ antiporter
MIAAAWCMAGLATLVAGAELMTRAGAQLAALVGISPVIIGLTVVAIGTSMPELAVGIEAALAGSGSLAVGNIAGTNTFNILFILGISALFMPLTLEVRAVKVDLPVMTVAAAALMLMSWDGLLTRLEGALLVGAGIVYTLWIIRDARRESRAVKAEFAGEYWVPTTVDPMREAALRFGLLVLGIAVIVIGAGWLVDASVDLARMLGVSEAFIGLTSWRSGHRRRSSSPRSSRRSASSVTSPSAT